MKQQLSILVLIILIALGLAACGENDKVYGPLEQLIVDVFDPQQGETVLIMMDLPNDQIVDHPLWSERRAMAEEWLEAFVGLEDELQISVEPMLTYMATGMHNGPLPESAEIDEVEVTFDEIMSDTNIVVALTEYSATAPLVGFTEEYNDLRAASMPGAMPSMMDTALSADYALVAERCQLLADRFDGATKANLIFSSGHELMIDLRYRHAKVDNGRLHSEGQDERVINLPSGEVYIAPYEGERPGQPSKTTGRIPVFTGDGSYVTFVVKENRVVDVEGEGPAVEAAREDFKVDDGRRNLAELGLGCNDKAVVTGNILEDEKVMGIHLAGGLSEHIGGKVGVDDFISPEEAFHQDSVYPFGGEIEVTSLIIEYEDESTETIVEDGRYTLFEY